MLKKLPDLLTYAVAAMLAYVFAREGVYYLSYDVAGMPIPVIEAPAPVKTVKPKTLKIVTYNVLYTPIALERRQKPLFKLLEEQDADIYAFQEAGTVGDWFMQQLVAEEWAKGYHRVGSEPDQCNGNFILSRVPVKEAVCYGLPGRQGRTVLIAELRTEAGELKIATTHMESPLQSGKVRAEQLGKIFKQLGWSREEAIFLGDLNFGDGEAEDLSIPGDYTDLWLKLRPKEPGYTWDNEKSPLANASKFAGEASRRIDRIVMRSVWWYPQSIEIIGDKPVDEKGDMFPSDHFGLAAVIEKRP